MPLEKGVEGTAKGTFSASGHEQLGMKQPKLNPSVEPPHRVIVVGERETPFTLIRTSCFHTTWLASLCLWEIPMQRTMVGIS